MAVEGDIDIDSAAVFVTFGDTRVMYSTEDIVKDAYEMVHGDGGGDDGD